MGPDRSRCAEARSTSQFSETNQTKMWWSGMFCRADSLQLHELSGDGLRPEQFVVAACFVSLDSDERAGTVRRE